MPELPEVETIRIGLEKAIKGKTIKAVEVRLPKIVAIGPQTVSNIRKNSPQTVQTFRRLLVGHRFVSIRRRAKVLMLDLSGPLTLLIHLKMTGQLIYAQKGEEKKVKLMNFANSPVLALPHKHTHVIFTFTDGAKLFFNDLRQFGYLRLVKDAEVKAVKELEEFGPEPLSPEFKLADLMARAKSRGGITVKQFLVDPKVVAGIGNIYSDEILYCAKIRPNRRARQLSPANFKMIYRCIRRVLKRAIQAQGSSVGDFFKADGTEGTFGKQHMVYGRYGANCRKCGSGIQKIKLGGRTSSYCPRCQN